MIRVAMKEVQGYLDEIRNCYQSFENPKKLFRKSHKTLSYRFTLVDAFTYLGTTDVVLRIPRSSSQKRHVT